MGSERKATTFFERHPLLAIVTIIMVTLIMCLSVVFGYFLNIYQLETTKEINEEETGETKNTADEMSRNSFEQPIEGNPQAPIEPDYYEFISRSEYDALPPRRAMKPLVTPIKRVIISHTATKNCTDFKQCSNIVRIIQHYHMDDKKYDDIGLNFLVGGDGRAYEGRGYHEGAHTKGYNFDSICIAFIGNFEEYEAPKRQLAAAQRIIEDGINANNIVPRYALFDQKQLNGFDSPGTQLHHQIKKWPRWSKLRSTKKKLKSKKMQH